ncbi:hypothetical protein LQZ18_06965 [Lachnospiraceae bacterium ZAX-1]
MSIVTLPFFIFTAVSMIVYWICHSKIRWAVLLCASVLFVLIGTRWNFMLYGIFAAMTLAVWGVAIKLKHMKSEKQKTFLTGCTIIVLLLVLVAYKENVFFVEGEHVFAHIFRLKTYWELPEWVAPFGISYFTLINISYLLDVRWGTIAEPQENPLKMLAFAGYFPHMTSGPFSRYNDMKDKLFGEVSWSLERFQFGLQRFFWGLFKKLVIAERLAAVVGTIYDTKPLPLQEDLYVGLLVLLGAFAYTALLYMDFSGCMDIVIGISEMFGIPLAENFSRPFSATTLSEIWRRWHITLGVWLKDYVLYPTLKSDWLNKIRQSCKNRFGKKAAKDIPTYIGMLIVWFCVGFWHGGTWKFVFSSGLFFFIMIVGGLILKPQLEMMNKTLHINTQCYSWVLFQRTRSFCLFSLAVSFGRRESLFDGFAAWKTLFTQWNPWVLFDDTLFELGLDRKDFDVMAAGLIVVLIVSMLQGKYGSVRQLIAKQNLAFRWMVYLALFFAVLVLGCYGSGYNMADFIYGGF